MKLGRKSRVGLVVRGALAGLALTFWCAPAFGQGGGGAGGGGGGGGAGATTGSTSSTASSFNTGGGGGGYGAVSSTANSAGSTSTSLGVLVFGSNGVGSSGVTGSTGTSTITTTTNPLAAFYANPISAGYGNNVKLTSTLSVLNLSSTGGTPTSILTGKGVFGVPVVAATTTTTTTKGVTGSTTSTNSGQGFTTQGIVRKPSYVTTLDNYAYNGFKQTQVSQVQGAQIQVTAAAPAALQKQAQAAVAESASLQEFAKSINVSVGNDNVIVLQGVVGTERNREQAERLVRLTPGVKLVRNELQVSGGN